MWEEITDLNTVLSMLSKLDKRAEQLRIRLDELVLGVAKRFRPLLAIEFVKQRLWIKRLDMTRTTRHEQEDDRPCFTRFWWLTNGPRQFVTQHRRHGQ